MSGGVSFLGGWQGSGERGQRVGSLVATLGCGTERQRRAAGDGQEAMDKVDGQREIKKRRNGE